MEAFKWGVIGPGSIAKDFANDLKLATSANHTIQAVLSKDIEEAHHFAQSEHALQYFDDLDTFIKSAQVDAVYIATPHTLHCEEAIACLQNKIPVLCEKPLGVNVKQVTQMIEAAQQHNTFLMEAMWIRLTPGIKQLLKVIEENAVGELVALRADISYKAPYDLGSRYFNPELGGGSLLDLGVYTVFLAQVLFGKPDKIQAYARLSPGNIDESCTMLLSYEGGKYATLESSFVLNMEGMAVVYGKTGKIFIQQTWNEKTKGITIQPYDSESTSYPCEWEGRGFQYEIDEVYSCIKAGKIESDYYSHQFSKMVFETMDEVRRQTGIVYLADK
jgi:scyllo-inositol 2-dehydrogenase (NADP+)